MALNVMVVGKFCDNFNDSTAKQNQYDLYKHCDDDDPNLLAVNNTNEVGARSALVNIAHTTQQLHHTVQY